MFIKNLLENNKKKVVAVIIFILLLTLIVETCILFFRKEKVVYLENKSPDITATPKKTATPKITPTPVVTATLPTFSSLVNLLKEEANAAFFNENEFDFSHTDKKLVIGEKLKEILSSEYAALLVNDTFDEYAFSVDIHEYSLKDGKKIRRITYSLYEKKYFFLQYIGDTTFFSDVKQITDEKKFGVFENNEGVFTFYIYSEKSYRSNGSYEPEYYANVYNLNQDGFNQQFITIPFSDFYNTELMQDGEKIKCVNPYFEFVFNCEKYLFEIPRGSFESDPVDYDIPGLLLGLSDSSGNLRTLFIYKENGTIHSVEYSDQIIFPRQNKLFSLKQYVVNKSFEAEERLEWDLFANKLLCAPLGTNNLTDELNKIFLSVPDGGHYRINDIPLYVGQDYICYKQIVSHGSFGKYEWSEDKIKFNQLDDLSRFKIEYKKFRVTADFNEITLTDFLYGENAEDFYQSDVRTIEKTLVPYIDFKYLAIKRNFGNWNIMIPVIDEYFNPINGSNNNDIKNYALYSKSIPEILASDQYAVDIKDVDYRFYGKDIVRFPGSNIFLTQYEHYIKVAPNVTPDLHDLTIPIKGDEYIVSINFAKDDTEIKEWKNELSKYKA